MARKKSLGSVSIEDTSPNKLTVPLLKEALKELGLSTSGRKADLVARLEGARAKQSSDSEGESEPHRADVVEETKTSEPGEAAIEEEEQPPVSPEKKKSHEPESSKMRSPEPKEPTEEVQSNVMEVEEAKEAAKPTHAEEKKNTSEEEPIDIIDDDLCGLPRRTLKRKAAHTVEAPQKKQRQWSSAVDDDNELDAPVTSYSDDEVLEDEGISGNTQEDKSNVTKDESESGAEPPKPSEPAPEVKDDGEVDSGKEDNAEKMGEKSEAQVSATKRLLARAGLPSKDSASPRDSGVKGSQLPVLRPLSPTNSRNPPAAPAQGGQRSSGGRGRAGQSLGQSAVQECGSETNVTCCIHVTNLVRPFSNPSLNKLLGEFGKVEDFWINAIKSHCLVRYGTETEAQVAKQQLTGQQWPLPSGRILNALFVTDEEWSSISQPSGDGRSAPRPAQPQPQKPAPRPTSPPKRRAEEAPRDEARASRTEERAPVSGDRRDHIQEESKESEPPAADVLDELFRKTKAKYPLYWLPNTPEVANSKGDPPRRTRASLSPPPVRPPPPPMRGGGPGPGFRSGGGGGYNRRGFRR